MSKELIEQLAKEHGGQRFRLHGDIGYSYQFTEPDLEAFAKAYQAAMNEPELIDIGGVIYNKDDLSEADLQYPTPLNIRAKPYQAAAPIDNVADYHFITQSDIEGDVAMSSAVAGQLLCIRDYLEAGDLEEAKNALYNLADPNLSATNGWARMEEIAKALIPDTQAYAQTQGQSIPDGYALVPIEPTEEMAEAGWKGYINSTKPAPYNMVKDAIQAAIKYYTAAPIAVDADAERK
jgi:hypothetical protein